MPSKVIHLLGCDEGALFSVIDYCDVLSHALFGEPHTVIRVQNPMKWQPNEIDGLYFSDHDAGQERLYPVEGKALSTGDAINLEQMLGAYLTMKARVPRAEIVPLGIQMIPEGFRIGQMGYTRGDLCLERYVLVNLEPGMPSWSHRGLIANQRRAMI